MGLSKDMYVCVNWLCIRFGLYDKYTLQYYSSCSILYQNHLDEQLIADFERNLLMPSPGF